MYSHVILRWLRTFVSLAQGESLVSRQSSCAERQRVSGNQGFSDDVVQLRGCLIFAEGGYQFKCSERVGQYLTMAVTHEHR